MDARLTPALQADVHLAALGDVHAAVRIAETYAHGQDASPADQHRHVGWLQYAAQLGDDAASYDLALHFRSTGEPAIAAVYEARATALGYVPPLALDHIRK
jgi:TPR repeat protein